MLQVLFFCFTKSTGGGAVDGYFCARSSCVCHKISIYSVLSLAHGAMENQSTHAKINVYDFI